MTNKDVMIYSLSMSKRVIGMFLADLEDAELLARPCEGANNIAWQIGHLIAVEAGIGKQLGIPYPPLPEALQALGSGKSSQTSPDGGKLSKAEYVDLFNQMRDATIAGLANVPESVFDQPSDGPIARLAPKKGDLPCFLANHSIMHAGQFSVVRRSLKKPVLF